MGQGLIRGSVCTACADNTGDDSIDARVKIRRIVNRRGQSFCDITNFPFLRSDLSFSVTSAAHAYSGASYLPTTFKRVVAAYLLDGSDRTPLKEVGIGESYEWGNPNDNQGKPNEFCISRIESGYWEIKFNRLPDATYTIYLEIELHWVDVDESSSGDSTELVITKDYYDYFVHYCSIERLKQQGDSENYAFYDDAWFNPMKPQVGLLMKMLGKLSSPLKQRAVQVDMEMCGKVLTQDTSDYTKEKAC